MATAIFFAGMCIGGAINPEWVTPTDGDYSALAYFAVGFIAYDIVKLLRG